MWRRVTSSLFGRVAAKAAPANPVSAVSATVSATVTGKVEGDKDKEAQHAILRGAIRELSQGLSKPLQLSPAATLQKWDAAFRGGSEPVTTEQLEELGRAYYEGGSEALEKDEAMAVAVWRAAADRGSVEASYSLAVCLREGRGCAKDSNEAYARMLLLAEKNSYHLAHYALAIMLTNAEGTPVDHTRALLHFKAAAKGGVLPALHNIANAYASGRGVKQSDHNAMLYYQAAADAGDPHGMFSLASWLHTGRGTQGGQKYPEKAFHWNLEAAQKGHPAAMFNVGAAFMSGVGTGSEGKDLLRAAGWFEKASWEGPGRLVEATINLGNMYRQGLGVPRDLSRAKQIFLRCAHFNKTCAKLLGEVVAEEQKALASPAASKS